MVISTPGHTLKLPRKLGIILMWGSHPRIPDSFGLWRDPDMEVLSRVTLVSPSAPKDLWLRG